MRLSKWAMVLAIAVSAFAAPEKFVQPTKDGTGVFKNEIR